MAGFSIPREVVNANLESNIGSVKDFGATGDGISDDSNSINAAIAAITGTGGQVYFPPGTYLCGSTITLPSGVALVGSQAGGDVFSATDALMPYRGSTLRLKSGTNDDLVRTTGFAGFTGVSSPSPAQSVPSGFALRHLTLDGNKSGNSSGWPLRIYGRAYGLDDVVIQNGASGGCWSEGASGGYEMEAHWSNFRITDCTGVGLSWNGPHDSMFTNGVVARNDGFIGINLPFGARNGGELFSNVHVWGAHTYSWSIGTQNASFTNCVADGSGVQIIGSGNTWIGGEVFGANVKGEVAFTMGDSTVRTVSRTQVHTRIYNYPLPSALWLVTPNTTSTRNVWQLSANSGGNTRYYFQGRTTLNGSHALPLGTITVLNTADFAATGTLYISDGTNTETAVSYTGKTGTTFTGCTGGTHTYADGTFVLGQLGASPERISLVDLDNAAQGLEQSGQWGLTRVITDQSFFGVGIQTLSPNSSVTALQHKRNETGRVDLNWDNSGAAGSYQFQNGATVEGRVNTSTPTWKTYGLTGAIQPGTATGLGGKLFSGSGAPTISATSGDFYFRTDTTGTANQRLYVCTGTTNWTGIL